MQSAQFTTCGVHYSQTVKISEYFCKTLLTAVHIYAIIRNVVK